MLLVREDEIRARVAAAFEATRERLAGLVPGARIEHVGSTAVARSLTSPENWTAEMASFVAPSQDGIDVGVQLIVAGSGEEAWFIGWRERLRADSGLRARYDQLKEEHADGSVEAYRAAKERLIRG